MLATIRTRTTVVVLALAALIIATVPVTAATAATPTCETPWGSTAKTATTGKYTTRPVTAVRAGRHDCYDRLVIDLGPQASTPGGQAVGYRVRYVDDARQIGTGDKVKLAGGAVIQITANAPAYDSNGRSTYTPTNRNKIVAVAGYSTFRQAAFLGSFEGQTEFGLGVRARLPMRAQVVAGPGANARLVIDVAHRW